jgi:hypothetical protein
MDTTVATLTEVMRSVSGNPDAVIEDWSSVPAAHRVENMTTHALHHVGATLTDGTTWRVFAKTLRPASESPGWAEIPEQLRPGVLSELDWLDEPRVYLSGLGDDLPGPLRLPTIWQVERTPARVTIWMEEVADVTPWDADRYHRTAVALGALAGRWPEARVTSELGFGRRDLEFLFFGKVSQFEIPALADDALWDRPPLSEVADGTMRADLDRLAEDVPGLLERQRRVPHGLSHGDATPDNFREPGDDSIVAVDWSYGNVGPVGSDLAQLVAGRFESGAADVGDLAWIVPAISDGYREGLAREGVSVADLDLETGWATHLAVRSVFSALLLPPSESDAATRHRLLTKRAALSRFGLDLALRVVGRR